MRNLARLDPASSISPVLAYIRTTSLHRTAYMQRVEEESGLLDPGSSFALMPLSFRARHLLGSNPFRLKSNQYKCIEPFLE